MGDVYVGKDTELGREVALKVLPSGMAESEERRARFKREARAIAALNHPNIVTVYSVEEANGVHFMTMELVRGKMLSGLLPRKGFSLHQFFEIVIPLADAIAAAHQEGITHRDLKPDNVMRGDDGHVKVLDFGLAKPIAGLAFAATDSDLPTQEMTADGLILGTVSYMSPEQAEGKPIDERSDIFSLGIVFYEMLTGERPFDGETPASTLSSIIKDTPQAVAELRPSIPRDLAKLLRRCLAKDPERRVQTCKDVRNELEELKEALSTGELHASEVGAAGHPSSSRSMIFAGAVVLLVTGIIVGALLRAPAGSVGANVPRLTKPFQVTSAIGLENHPTWSPGGGRIAYTSDQNGNADIWVSQVSGGSAVNLTEDFMGGDSHPSWSPDGSQIAFKSERDGGGCFVMSALGGMPRRVVSQPNFQYRLMGGPAWSPDGAKLACPHAEKQSGNFVDIVTLATRDVERLPLEAQYAATDLSWSPDGRFVAYVDAINPVTAQTTFLWLMSVSGESVRLNDGTTEAWSPVWPRDGKSVFYVSNRSGSHDLWMQELSEDAQSKGEPVPVTTGLGIQSVSFSADGTKLAYSKGGLFANVWRVPVLPDRAATWSDAEQLTFDQAYAQFVDLSPDGLRLVINSNRAGFPDLWTLPPGGGELQPLTNDLALDAKPAWSPDGLEIAFYSTRVGNRDIFVIPRDGGPARQLTTHPGGDIMPSWSPDGRRIAYVSVRDGNFDVWVMSATGEDKKRLTDREGTDRLPDWSPDGRSMVYESERGGSTRLWRVSADGGQPERLTKRESFLPKITPDGETVYFRGPLEQSEYWALSLEDRTERLVADLSGRPGKQGTFALTTDGEYLYFTWEEALGDIWIMDVARGE